MQITRYHYFYYHYDSYYWFSVLITNWLDRQRHLSVQPGANPAQTRRRPGADPAQPPARGALHPASVGRIRLHQPLECDWLKWGRGARGRRVNPRNWQRCFISARLVDQTLCILPGNCTLPTPLWFHFAINESETKKKPIPIFVVVVWMSDCIGTTNYILESDGNFLHLNDPEKNHLSLPAAAAAAASTPSFWNVRAC